MAVPHGPDKHGIPALVGMNIARARKNANLSQEELAGLAGYSPLFLGQLERGERAVTLEHVYAIAGALNIHPIALIADCLPDHLHADYGPDFLPVTHAPAPDGEK